MSIKLVPAARPGRARGKMISCECCGEPFYQRPSDTKRGGGRFCSKACAYSARRCYAIEQRVCQECGAAFPYSAKPHSNNTGLFCSRPCYNQNQRKRVGPLNPSWRGTGKPNRAARQRKDYVAWRKAVYERDDYTCQSCHERGVYLHAHHIKPFSTHPESRLDVSNGITLCARCHKHEHGGTFRVDLSARMK